MINSPFSTKSSTIPQVSEIDEGLRLYMLRVYNYMTAGLALTSLVSFVFYKTGLWQVLYTSVNGVISPNILGWIVMFAPLIVLLIPSNSVSSAQMKFWVFSGLMGASLSNILLAFTGASVLRTFLVCTATFAAMSIYGYTTKRDLTKIGSFLIMGLIGLIIASLVNLFLKSSGLDLALSFIGVLLFTGLTAFDTQKIRNNYDDFAGNSSLREMSAIYGALALYLDFINLFLYLLRFMGDRRN